MAIQIGERSLATARPADLDAQLVAQTGCTAAEHLDMLAPTATPFQLARPLEPFLTGTDEMPVEQLADLIAAADPIAVRAQVVALLAETAAPTSTSPVPTPPASEVPDGQAA